MERPYRICTRCVMDTSDPEIVFDERGVCNHCREYDRIVRRHLHAGAERERRIDALVGRIKRRGRGRDYDCVIGLSGGVDSSFLAYKVREIGLRPLAVHLDNGWNSELAVANIERIVRKLDIDLYTHVIDWEEFRDLQVAFLRASVVDIEMLTDHAIAAVIYKIARKRGIGYFLSGYNVATESSMPRSWFYGNKLDSRNIRSIYRTHGNGMRLRSFPALGFLEYLGFLSGKMLRVVPWLNFIDYNRSEAVRILEEKLGWVNYGGKHYESRFTHFYQAYILPVKFRVDKRRAHLSNLIYSSQIPRDRALRLLEEEISPVEKLMEEKEYVIKKLGLTSAQFEEYMRLPPRDHLDFPSYERYMRPLRFMWSRIGGVLS